MRPNSNRARKGIRKVVRYVGLLSLLAAIVMGWEFLAHRGEQMKERTAHQEGAAWGEEVLSVGAAVSWPTSIIPPANACSAGASSCFQCHNGVRAAAPADESWHADHQSVNNSCAGCHKGNPRILREDLAHRNMLADPRTQPQESCASCHHGEDLEALVRHYMPAN